MPDGYDTYAEPTLTIYESDVTQNWSVKVEKNQRLTSTFRKR